jgi:hypothetical protein
VQKDPPLVSLMSQISPLHALPSYFFETHYNNFLPSTPRSSRWSSPFNPSVFSPEDKTKMLSKLCDCLCSAIMHKFQLHISDVISFRFS